MIVRGTFPTIPFPDRELSLRLGRAVPAPQTEPGIAQVCETAEFRYCYTRLPLSFLNDSVFLLGSERIESAALAKNLRGCDEAFVFAATLGSGIDRLIARLGVTSAARQFVADAAASALAEGLAHEVNALLRRQSPCKPRFSPGFADFTLDYQPLLLRLTDANRQIGLSLTDTLFLTPLKSVTAVVGICPTEREGS